MQAIDFNFYLNLIPSVVQELFNFLRLRLTQRSFLLPLLLFFFLLLLSFSSLFLDGLAKGFNVISVINVDMCRQHWTSFIGHTSKLLGPRSEISCVYVSMACHVL